MGREIKRVPIDFDWPLDKIWQGYQMPESLQAPNCEACNGRGATAARQWVQDIAHLALMLNTDLRDQQQGRPLHPYLHDIGSHAYGTRPSPDITEFCVGLAGRGEPGRFHDTIDGWRATDKLIEAAGLDPKVWGICPQCHGAGTIEAYPGQDDEAEAWERTEPPAGDGWQVWETVSEGSPITPVFATDDELIEHLATVGTLWDQRRGDGAWRRSAAESFVRSGWAPSGMVKEGEVLAGGRDSDRM